MELLANDNDFYVTKVEKKRVKSKFKSCTTRDSFNVTLFSDTNTLKIQYEYTQIQCVGLAKEGYIKRVSGLMCTVYNPRMPNIDALISDTHTFSTSILKNNVWVSLLRA